MKKEEIQTPTSRFHINKIALIIILLLVLAGSVYYAFFTVSNCKNIGCFNNALAKCSKVKFENVQDEATWIYTIKGAQKGKCVVNVESTNVKISEANAINGKEMLCYIPRGLVIAPEGELDSCHGLLKEELQNIIIKKLHMYIVENIGKISEDVQTPL